MGQSPGGPPKGLHMLHTYSGYPAHAWHACTCLITCGQGLGRGLGMGAGYCVSGHAVHYAVEAAGVVFYAICKLGITKHPSLSAGAVPPMVTPAPTGQLSPHRRVRSAQAGGRAGLAGRLP